VEGGESKDLVLQPDVEAMGWCGYMWSAVLRSVGRIAKFSKVTLAVTMVEKITLNDLATALVDIPAVSVPIACSPQSLRHLWHCVVRGNCTF
jgi:proteasome lid subunit RPN8/RPN11